MAKITDRPDINTNAVDTAGAKSPRIANTQFADLLTQSRMLADKLTIHKPGGPYSMPVTPISEAANSDTLSDHTPQSENLMEIGLSIATLMGKLSMLRASKK